MRHGIILLDYTYLDLLTVIPHTIMISGQAGHITADGHNTGKGYRTTRQYGATHHQSLSTQGNTPKGQAI